MERMKKKHLPIPAHQHWGRTPPPTHAQNLCDTDFYGMHRIWRGGGIWGVLSGLHPNLNLGGAYEYLD